MEDRLDDLMNELTALQRHRGLQGPEWASNTGPLLTRIFGLDQLPEGDRRRSAIIEGLLRHADGLPPDLGYVFLSACAVRATSRPALTQRIEDASKKIQRDPRTTWRRLGKANERVAQVLAGELDAATEAPPSEWALISLRASTDLSVHRPEFRSVHTIRVISPYLTHITERISFPGAEPDADPGFKVSGDARLLNVERLFQVTWVVTMELTRAFGVGETATYSLTVQAPSRRLVHPMSVMLPEREIRSFSTEVNFGSPSVASRVWRLDGVPAPMAELDEPSGELLDPDSTPVLKASYDAMVRGRVYGLRWSWADHEQWAPATTDE